MATLDDFLSFLQGASNSAASTVSAPVDGINWLLGKAGVPVSKKPVGGAEWLRELGFTAEPKNKTAGLLGEAVGGVLPIVAQAKAPQIAAGLLRGMDNLTTPATLSKQAGVVKMGSAAKELPYQIEHKPMRIEGGASPLHDLIASFGDDVYGRNAMQFFGSGDPRERKVLDIMKKVRGNPDAEVTLYRGVPDNVNEINPGDWVTLLPEYAADYGKVISKKVKASQITSWPDSLAEFGYWPD